MRWILNLFQSIIAAVFGFCTHRNQSRPFTIDGQTYKVCMDCSQQIFYSRETMLPLSRRELRHLRAEQAAAAVMADDQITIMPAGAEVLEVVALRAHKSAAA